MSLSKLSMLFAQLVDVVVTNDAVLAALAQLYLTGISLRTMHACMFLTRIALLRTNSSYKLRLVPFGCGYPSTRRTMPLSHAWLQVPRDMIRALELHGYARFRFVQDFVKKRASTCVNDNLLRWKPINTHERQSHYKRP